MTTMTTAKRASERSIAYLTDLVSDRDVQPGKSAAEAQAQLGKWLSTPRSQKEVSDLIDKALRAPRRSKVPIDELIERMRKDAKPVEVPESVPNLKFAILSGALAEAPPSWKKQEYTFFEVKNLRGRRVIRRLLGAPGRFTRHEVPAGVATEVFRFVNDQEAAMAASKRFGELYSVCRRCGAELTDDLSRERVTGPVCHELLSEWLVTGREPSLKK